MTQHPLARHGERQPPALAKGDGLAAGKRTGDWVLPYASVIVLDGDRIAGFVDIAPDWLRRAGAEPVLRAIAAPPLRERARAAG